MTNALGEIPSLWVGEAIIDLARVDGAQWETEDDVRVLRVYVHADPNPYNLYENGEHFWAAFIKYRGVYALVGK